MTESWGGHALDANVAPERCDAVTPERSTQLVLACSGDLCNYITKSPKHLDDYNQEMTMTTNLSTKFAALGVALLANAMLLSGIAVLFSGRTYLPAPVSSVVLPVAVTYRTTV
jgi:hypothetical protein